MVKFSTPTFYKSKNARDDKVITGRIFKKNQEIFIVALVESHGGAKKHPVLLHYKGGSNWRHYCSLEPQHLPPDEIPQEVKSLYEDFFKEGADECWRKHRNPHIPIPIKGVGDYGVGCKHCEAAFASFAVFEIIDLTPSTPSPASTIEDKEWWRRHLEEGYNLLLEGPPGEGKSRLAYEIASQLVEEGWEAIYIDGGPHVGAKDLLGGVSIRGGETRYRPGLLLKAFMQAEKGKRVVVVIDELPRIPCREQGILVASLFPKWIGGKRVYTLSVPELGQTFFAPAENLWFIATGNIGENYTNSALSDKALEERFAPETIKMDLNQVQTLLTELVVKRGFSPSLAQKLVKVRERMEKAYEEGVVATFLSFRQLERAVKLARKEEEVPQLLLKYYSRDMEERAVLEKALQGVFT